MFDSERYSLCVTDQFSLLTEVTVNYGDWFLDLANPFFLSLDSKNAYRFTPAQDAVCFRCPCGIIVLRHSGCLYSPILRYH
jgi:hypothetical protein